MRRIAAIGVVALLLLAIVPGATTGATTLTKHVDGSVVVRESATRLWLSRFEVRTTIRQATSAYRQCSSSALTSSGSSK